MYLTNSTTGQVLQHMKAVRPKDSKPHVEPAKPATNMNKFVTSDLNPMGNFNAQLKHMMRTQDYMYPKDKYE